MTRHTVMVVGQTGGGKSVILNTLARAETKMGKRTSLFVLNPKVSRAVLPAALAHSPALLNRLHPQNAGDIPLRIWSVFAKGQAVPSPMHLSLACRPSALQNCTAYLTPTLVTGPTACCPIYLGRSTSLCCLAKYGSINAASAHVACHSPFLLLVVSKALACLCPAGPAEVEMCPAAG